MFIVIEGPDGCGKTTLAQHLSKALNLPYFHSGGRQNIDTLRTLANKIDENPDGLIVDRFPLISESVYSTVLEREVTITEDDCEIIMRDPYIVVFCITSDQEISKEFKSHKDDQFRAKIEENKTRIYNQYIRYFADNPPDYTYDWRLDDLGVFTEIIREQLCAG